MACVRYITPKRGPKRGEEVESMLYNDLYSLYSEEVADQLYGNIFTEKFKEIFGDWETNPSKWERKLDKNGEPLTSLITPFAGKNLEKISNPETYYVPNTAKKIDIEKETKWFKENLPDTVNLEVTERLIKGQLFGNFEKGSVYLYENATEGVLYHEAFHAVSQMFLTRGERNSVYNEYRRRSPENKNLSEEQVEEALADEFSEYIMSNGTYVVPEAGKKQRSFFRSLLDTILGLFYNSNITINELYNNIKTQKYAKGPGIGRRAENFFNKYEAKSYAKKVEIYRETEEGQETALTANEIGMIMDSMTYYLLDSLFQDEKLDPFVLDNAIAINSLYRNGDDGVYERMRTQLKEDEEKGLAKTVSRQTGESKEEAENRLASIYNAIDLMNEDNLNNWEKLVELHKKYLKEYGIQSKEQQIKEDEIDNFMENIVEEKISPENGRNFFIESIYFNTKDGVPNAVKMLIAGLAKRTNATDYVINDLGLRIPVNYDSTFNTIANKMAGVPARWESFENKLIELQKEIPSVKWLSEKLKVGFDPQTIEKPLFDLRIQFVQAFSKNKYNYNIGLIKRDKVERLGLVDIIEPGDITFIDSNTNTVAERVREEWKGNLERNFSEITGENKWEKLIEDINDILYRYKNEKNIEEKKKILYSAFEKLGIELSGAAAEKVLEDTSSEGGVLMEKGQRKAAFDVINDIITYLDKEQNLYSPVSGVAEQIKGLITTEALFSTERIANQHINPEGKTVYGITLNTYISLITGELNEIASLPTEEEREKALEKNLPHIYYSRYASRSIFKEKILKGESIQLGVFDGYKYDIPGLQGIPTKSLKAPDKYSQFVNSTLKGIYSFLRTADRGIENSISFTDKSDLIQGEYEAVDTFKKYLIDEILTAKALKEGGSGNYISFYQDILKSPNSIGLRIFDDIITRKELRGRIRDFVNDKNITEEEIENSILESEDVSKDLIFYFNGRKREEARKMQELGIYRPISDTTARTYGFSGDVLENNRLESIDKAIEKYIWNSTAAFIEQTKLFFGDPAYFGNTDNAFKRFSMFNSTKKISVGGVAFETGLNIHYPRTDKKVTNRNVISTIIYEDVEAESTYIPELTKIFKDSLLKRKNSDGKKVFTSDGKTLNGKGEIRLAALLSPYKNMTEADAQGFISIDEYRELMVRAGDWTTTGKKSKNNKRRVPICRLYNIFTTS